jgi:hypothetical protein
MAAWLVVVGIWFLPATPARADFPSFGFSVEQRDQHVWLEAQTSYHNEPDPYTPECLFTVIRSGSNGRVTLFNGDLGSVNVDCTAFDAGACVRTCEPFVDRCPCPGHYTYTLERLFMDPTPGFATDEVHREITVVEASGSCTPPEGAVVGPENDSCGCSCRHTRGRATAHVLVLLFFLGAAALGRSLRRSGRGRYTRRTPP